MGRRRHRTVQLVAPHDMGEAMDAIARTAPGLLDAQLVAYRDALRESGAHCPLGDPPVCPMCDVPYPCPTMTENAPRRRSRPRADQGKRSTAPHGTRTRYNAGCSCAPCRRANADYITSTRRSRR